MARAQINHASDSRAATRHTATSSARVDIWVRTIRGSRQAFYRCSAAGVANWQAIGVPLANKALKLGSISLPGISDATVVGVQRRSSRAPDGGRVRRARSRAQQRD